MSCEVVEVVRVICATVFGVVVFGLLIWGMSR